MLFIGKLNRFIITSIPISFFLDIYFSYCTFFQGFVAQLKLCLTGRRVFICIVHSHIFCGVCLWGPILSGVKPVLIRFTVLPIFQFDRTQLGMLCWARRSPGRSLNSVFWNLLDLSPQVLESFCALVVRPSKFRIWKNVRYSFSISIGFMHPVVSWQVALTKKHNCFIKHGSASHLLFTSFLSIVFRAANFWRFFAVKDVYNWLIQYDTQISRFITTYVPRCVHSIWRSTFCLP